MELRLDLAQIVQRRLRRRVATIGEHVEQRAGAAFPAEANQGREVIQVTVHTAVRYQAKQMHRASLTLGQVCGVEQRRVGEEFAAPDRVVDMHDVLSNDVACAEDQMADLGVTHLTIRKADGMTRGIQRGVRIATEIGIQLRRVRLRNAIVAFARIDAETVQYDQDDRLAWYASYTCHWLDDPVCDTRFDSTSMPAAAHASSKGSQRKKTRNPARTPVTPRPWRTALVRAP